MSLHRLTVIFSLLLPRNIASFNRSCISQFGRSQLYSTQRIDSNSGDCVEDNDCTKGYNESNEVINEDNNNNESNNSSNLFFDDPAKKIVGSFKPLMRIIFTCGICKSKVDKKFSKRSYEKGVVFITCPVCKSNHLIADNLGWFSDIEGKNIEGFMAAKGQKVKRILESAENDS